MLAAHQRLNRPVEFSTTVRQGQRVGRRHVVVHVKIRVNSTPDEFGHDALRLSRGERSARVGLIVSKAVGPAVTRHQVSRKLRGVMAGVIPTLPGGVAVVLRALPAAAGASSGELAQDINAALHRLGAFNTAS